MKVIYSVAESGYNLISVTPPPPHYIRLCKFQWNTIWQLNYVYTRTKFSGSKHLETEFLTLVLHVATSLSHKHKVFCSVLHRTCIALLITDCHNTKKISPPCIPVKEGLNVRCSQWKCLSYQLNFQVFFSAIGKCHIFYIFVSSQNTSHLLADIQWVLFIPSFKYQTTCTCASYELTFVYLSFS